MSQPISWPLAQSYATSYQSAPFAIKNSEGQVIKGFRLDAQQVASVLGLTGTPSVAELFIILGKNPAGEFTTIVAGIDSVNNINTNNIIDFSLPCPNNCPNNF